MSDQNDPKLAYVIPTKDRPDDMRNLLKSLQEQTVKPDQVIVVDGSDPDIRDVVDEFPALSIDYVRVFPPSLAKQRNAGMAALRDDIDVAGYLDDDMVPDPDGNERMRAFWRQADERVCGAAYSIQNQPRAFSPKLASFFYLDHPTPGRLLASSFQSQIPTITETQKVEWLYGGATFWRRRAIENFSYDEWYLGHGYLEDVDYSYRVSREFDLYVVAEAKINHYTKTIPLSAQFKLGQQQIANRAYFFRKMGTFKKMPFLWAIFGQVCLNLFSSLRHLDTAGIRRLAGNFRAMNALFGSSGQIRHYYK